MILVAALLKAATKIADYERIWNKNGQSFYGLLLMC